MQGGGGPGWRVKQGGSRCSRPRCTFFHLLLKQNAHRAAPSTNHITHASPPPPASSRPVPRWAVHMRTCTLDASPHPAQMEAGELGLGIRNQLAVARQRHSACTHSVAPVWGLPPSPKTTLVLQHAPPRPGTLQQAACTWRGQAREAKMHPRLVHTACENAPAACQNDSAPTCPEWPEVQLAVPQPPLSQSREGREVAL